MVGGKWVWFANCTASDFATVMDRCCANFGGRNWRAGEEMSAVVMG